MSSLSSLRILRAALPLSIALGLAGACSYPWSDYQTTTGTGGGNGGATSSSSTSSSTTSSSTTSSSTSSSSGGCTATEKMCGGACVSATDPQFGCGAADCTPCAIANGTATCAAGACAVATCDAGFGDCTGGAADGCETDTNTSLAHCGGCNKPCATSCVGGTCLKEDCTNGVDDDGDGLADCADPDCNPITTCVDAAPTGWNGPVVLYDGPTATAPTCAAAGGTTSYQGFNGLVADPPTCSACACAPDISCTPAQVSEYSDFTCTTLKGTVTQPAAPACANDNTAMVKAYKVAPPTATIGACSPSGGVLTSGPPSWASTGLACAPAQTGAGCMAAQLCVASPGAPFAAGACIWTAGDQACPTDYPTKHAFKNGADDSRSCSACTCTGAGTGSCTVATQLFGASNCGGGVSSTVPDDGACHKVGGAPSLDALVTKSGSCPASGGAPTGQIVEGAAITTVCCTP